jgi:hypothetical protein
VSILLYLYYLQTKLYYQCPFAKELESVSPQEFYQDLGPIQPKRNQKVLQFIWTIIYAYIGTGQKETLKHKNNLAVFLNPKMPNVFWKFI